MRKSTLFFVGAVVTITGVALSAIGIGLARTLPESVISEATSEPRSLDNAYLEPSFREFTIVGQEVFQPNDGPSYRRAQSTLYRRADGVFATIRLAFGETSNASSPEITVGERGRGVFLVNQIARTLVFMGPLREDATAPLAEDLRRSERFQGEATTLGYRTIILRKQGRSFYVDNYYAPDLESVIKTVTVAQQGTTTVEPTSIILGSIDNSIFTALAAFTIDTSLYQMKLEKVERVPAEMVIAEELRRHIQAATRPRTQF